MRSRRPPRPCKPLFQVISLLPVLLFPFGLMNGGIAVLPTCVGLVAGIDLFLLGPTTVTGDRRGSGPALSVGAASATVVLPI